MIHSFSLSNFTSFQDETDISFILNKKDSTDDTSVLLASGTRVSKIMTLIGPNASGKSNLLKVLVFLRFFLVDAWQLPPDVSLLQLIQPFRLVDSPAGKMAFSCIFEIDGSIYEIKILLEDGFVVSETIRTKTKTESRYTWKTLYSREKSNKEFRKNASLLFTLEREEDTLSHIILNYWRTITSDMPLTFQPFRLNGMHTGMNYYIQNPNLLPRLNEMIRKFDFGFDRIDMKTVDSSSYNFQVVHKINGREYDVLNLSEGTMSMINILPMIFSALDTGGAVIFDELDANLHPEVVDAILDLFASKIHNPKHAQIFFSTHNPRVMNRLFKYQVHLVEKDKESGVSHSWRLDEMEGIRIEDNYYTKYMAGAYGARPNITL